MEYLSAHLYNSSTVASGFNDNEWKNGGRGEALLEILKDCVHAVNLYLLSGLTESPSEVPYGFFLFLYYGLQRTNIPLLPH